jgi:hypothetical protein
MDTTAPWPSPLVQAPRHGVWVWRLQKSWPSAAIVILHSQLGTTRSSYASRDDGVIVLHLKDSRNNSGHFEPSKIVFEQQAAVKITSLRRLS